MKYIKDQENLEGKIVLLRLDLNVPLKNQVITDETRINKILPVINFLIKKKSKILNSIKNLNPEIFEACKKTFSNIKNDLDFQRLDAESFEICPNISVDVAVMEKTNLGTVIPLEAGWSDIGSWESLWENEEKDSSGNVIKGKVYNSGSSNCYVQSENRLLVTLGLKDIVLVETSDAILAAQKSELSNIVLRESKISSTLGLITPNNSHFVIVLLSV